MESDYIEDRYLFKAKRLDNGEWVEGYLIYSKKDCYICEKPYECMGEYSSLTGQSYGFGGFKLVDPHTICQCTGLKDESGNLIWENDVVRVTINSGSTICRCAFADTVAHFQLWQKYTIKSTSTVLNLGNYECEVIGNIFDNKGLLESEG